MSKPIAVLGATSLLARDFIVTARSRFAPKFHLYARRPDRVAAFLAEKEIGTDCTVAALADFPGGDYSAVVNFIGAGDPLRVAGMGEEILSLTQEWDRQVLAYLDDHPDAAYIFLSSGAVYGGAFQAPADENTFASPAENFYAAAKQHAETGHRAQTGRTIFDIRIFNYISRAVDLKSRFLIAEMLNAVMHGTLFKTDARMVVRDYLHPLDFCALVEACLAAPPGTNAALDAYSKAPIDKTELIALMAEFGLRCEIVPQAATVNATGDKPFYYSQNRRAGDFGYRPVHSSRSGIIEEAKAILAGAR